GIIISLVLIVFALALQFLDLSKNKAVGSLQFLFLVGALIWSCVSYAKQLDGNVTFGNVFAHGFKTAAAITAIMVVYTVISLKFINPEALDIALREARTNMEAKNMSDDQTETAINFTKKFFLPLAIGGTLFIFLFIGLIGSLIGAAVAKKNPAGPFVQQA
ncbi:MAG TPA: DUF4199 domain-containing protein, partial [Segetibacter sp.]